jgi:hypothetical protein
MMSPSRSLSLSLSAVVVACTACNASNLEHKQATGAVTRAQPVVPPAATGAAHDHDHMNHDAPAADTGTAPKEAVMFVWPQPGSTVFNDFDVVFGVNGKRLRPAGEDPADKTSGHHHVLVDVASVPAGTVIPMDATHLHFGKAQTGARLTLAAGKHALEMQLADGAHISYGPALSSKMDVVVVNKPKEAIAVSFKNLKEGATIDATTKIEFALAGMKVRPAGEDVLDKTTGHHHIIVDGETVPAGVVVAKDATHIHFGKGETSTTLALSPGPHTLTLQLADGAHASYGPALSQTIHVTAK